MSTKPVVARMESVLKPLGFRRHKATWNRRFDSFVDVIDVQTSKSGDSITVNAGVLHADVHRRCWATDLPAVIEEPSCTVRIRIGQLVEGKDLWWPLSDRGTVSDVVDTVTACVLPFLERLHSLEAMEQFLTTAQVTKSRYPPPIIYLAILKSLQGNGEDACGLLAELARNSVDPWKARIGEVCKRLACA